MSDETKVVDNENVEENSKVKQTATESDKSLATETDQSKQEDTKSNDTNVKVGPKRISHKAQRTKRIQIKPLLVSADSEEDLLQTIPEVNMDNEKTAALDENTAILAETEEQEMEELLVKESPRILKCLSDFVHGIWTLIKVFGRFGLRIWSKLKCCLPSFVGVAVGLSLCYGLDYFTIPLTNKDLPHYPARLQYISRMAALSLFPIICCWFVGLSPVLARLVQSTLRDLVLMIVVHCALVTFLPVEQMHWISIFMFVTVLFRLVYWFSVCHDLPALQAASEGPLQLCHITITLFTFLSILAQELGYMQTPTITRPCSADMGTDSPEWVYPTMCNVMQRLFCGASKPDHLHQ